MGIEVSLPCSQEPAPGPYPEQTKYTELVLPFVLCASDFVRFQVLTAASMKMAVFRVEAPCGLVEVYRRFRDTFCLHR
jgi:hypothetical protein